MSTQLVQLVEQITESMERWRNLLSLGGMEKRDEMLLKDVARGWMVATSPAHGQNPAQASLPVAIVDRAVALGYPRLRRGEDGQLGKAVAAAYRRAHQGEEPPKHAQWSDGRTIYVCSYTTDDLCVIDAAIHAYFANRK